MTVNDKPLVAGSPADSVYLCIDLKSFYASVECIERDLDPLSTNLVVADRSRTNKTICLAVSPALKARGIPGRPRLFEVEQKVHVLNEQRRRRAPNQRLVGESSDDQYLQLHPETAIGFITAPPRMAKYMEVSTKIYSIYLRYIAPEDIHVYSIDEVFIDLTHYLKANECTPREMANRMIHNVLHETGITATAGIGTNMYLAKIAMDIVAKHIPPDANGIRIAELDERTYREKMWTHEPLTDFWRVGRGYAKKLEARGLRTMGDIARCSIGASDEFYNEELLYKLFGVNAELLIDHAWGWEPCPISEVKKYKPEANSLGVGQVLMSPYTFDKAKVVLMEMTDGLTLDLVDKGLVTDQLVLTIGYDIENMKDPEIVAKYQGEIKVDLYGRTLPKHAHGTANLGKLTSSSTRIMKAMLDLYARIVDPMLLIRRITISANHVVSESEKNAVKPFEQMSLLDQIEEFQEEEADEQKEHDMQKTLLDIKKKFGKNAILKGTNFEEGATGISRNDQIGGHKA